MKNQIITLSSFVLYSCVSVQALDNGSKFSAELDFIQGEILHTHYDGRSDDLLSAGFGKNGLAGPPPNVADPENPSVSELRRLAIYNNYRALVDTAEGGGYGVFYGPNVTTQGKVTNSQGLIAGDEYIAFADDGKGQQNVTMMVQIPKRFDPTKPCLVAAPSSGSRGIYGAIGTVGEWGLKRGCAVAYTDKGTGTGVHNLQNNAVGLITGKRTKAKAAGKQSTFTADISPTQREALNANTPYRFAFKHAHSQQNPEKDWGQNVLESIEFVFYILNEKFGKPGPEGKKVRTILPKNTLVIASSISNGGGSSIRAAEQDRKGLIDAVVVSEPNVTPRLDGRFGIRQGYRKPFYDHSKSLYEYTTILNVYQGCASLDPAIADDAPLNSAKSTARCESLREKGLCCAKTKSRYFSVSFLNCSDRFLPL